MLVIMILKHAFKTGNGADKLSSLEQKGNDSLGSEHSEESLMMCFTVD